MAKVVQDTGFSSSTTSSVNTAPDNNIRETADIRTADSPLAADLSHPRARSPESPSQNRESPDDDRSADKQLQPPSTSSVQPAPPTSDTVATEPLISRGETEEVTDQARKDQTENDKEPTEAGAIKRMNRDMPESGEGWRAFYEHPLTAATTAMLNINGAESNEEQVQGIGGLLCDYYPQNNKAVVPLSTQPNTQETWSVTSTIAAPTATTMISTGEQKVKIVPVDTSKLVAAVQSSSPQHNPTSVVLGEQMNVYLMNQANIKETDVRNGPIIVNCKTIDPSEISEHNSAQNINSLVNNENVSVNLPNGDINGHHSTSAIVSIIKQEPLDESTNSSLCEQSSILAAELKGNRLAKSPVMDNVVLQHTPGTPGTPGTPVMIEAAPTALSPTEIVSQSPQPPSYSNQVFATLQQAQVYEPVTVPGAQFGILPTVVVQQPSQNTQVYGTQALTNSQPTSTVYSLTTTDYYKQYYDIEPNGNVTTQTSQATEPYQVRQQMYQTTSNGHDMFIRQNGTAYKNGVNSGTMGLTVDLPSPDSGIGETAVTPRDNTNLTQVQMFDYSEITPQAHSILTSTDATTMGRQSNRRSWHEYGRGSDSDKIQIPKLYSDVGYKYHLESPISTSQRRDDDRITYINKGQFYGITLEYIPDPDKQICSQTVKSMIMLVFREEKSHEDEIKAWQFWHSRQHSVKQRILDADTKNSSGIVGCIDEITHNAITFYWNPLEGPAKVNIAVQCLSTDFSNQKGVKGLPLHLQIDTFEDINLVNRAYCQIKVFCDKGAERKTRDEERRAAKRKLTATGRKKMDEMYHSVCERSEFYTMRDVSKPPVLFSPSEDIEKLSGMELNFYNQPPQPTDEISLNTPTTRVPNDAKETSDLNSPEASIFQSPSPKRPKIVPPINERVMLYVRQENEETFNALHVVPPNMFGLCNAFENKYNIRTENIKSIFKRSRKGVMVTMDDDIIKHYSNEDSFLIKIATSEDNTYEIVLIEL